HDPEFERIVHAWSNDLAVAHWWLRSPVRERLIAAGDRWGFRIADGALEAHLRGNDKSWPTDALAAAAALAGRGGAFEKELEEARSVLVGTGATIDVVREETGVILPRIHTHTRLSVSRVANQEPFSLEQRLIGGTGRLYDEVAPARVEADDRTLRLDLDGI